MVLSRKYISAGLLAAALLVGTGKAHAAEPSLPASDPAIRLDSDMPSVLVRTNVETILLRNPRVTAVGLTGSRDVVAGRTMVRNRTEPALIAWQDIDRVEQSSSGVTRGLVVGAVAGALAGGAAWILYDRPHPPTPDAGDFGSRPPGVRGFMFAGLGTVTGAVAGGLVGVCVPVRETIWFGPRHAGSPSNPSE